MQPDLILANKEENVKEQIDALEAIAPVWISDVTNLEEAIDMIRQEGNRPMGSRGGGRGKNGIWKEGKEGDADLTKQHKGEPLGQYNLFTFFKTEQGLRIRQSVRGLATADGPVVKLSEAVLEG